MRWSNSMLYTAQQCGERFYRRYILRDFRPSGVKAKRGTAVHKVAAESHLRQLKAKTDGAEREEYLVGVLPSVEEAKDMAADSFQAAMSQGCAYSEDERAVGPDKVVAAEKDAAVAMGAHYVQRVAPQVDPLAVEKRWIIRPANTEDEIQGIVDLVAEETRTIDLVDRAVRRKVTLVIDTKTKDRSPRDTDAMTSQQLTVYAMIYAAVTGAPPDYVQLNTIVRTSTGKVSHVQLTAQRSRADLEAVAARLNASMEAVKRGTFVPANPDSWWCSEKFCEYWSECKFALGRR